MIEKELNLNRPNWLGSAVGLVLKSISIPANFATTVTENNRTIVQSGTIYAEDGGLLGLVYGDVDITDGAAKASLMIRGSYINANLPATAASVAEDFAAQGLYAFDEGSVTRPNFGSIDLDTVPVPLSMFAYLADESVIEIEDNALTMVTGDELLYVKVQLNVPVTVTPNATTHITISGEDYVHGTISADEDDASIIYITPIGNKGQIGPDGEFSITAPANSVKNGTKGNAEVVITLTVPAAQG